MCLGVQHVPGDSGGLHSGPQGRSSGLVVCPAHSAVEEDGSRPAGLRTGQSSESAGCHKVGGGVSSMQMETGGQNH